ncbi:hypothetical protein HK099_007186 [Clydaea vesicula]|uniref:DOMON domain-containing protein n=1 Tax=Clydaea vesicula TaxID=447962 RepID=A0AAD5XTV8_9FUNG|nr:hypothetical protein HK099_007186 [Clydaea vesicula]
MKLNTILKYVLISTIFFTRKTIQEGLETECFKFYINELFEENKFKFRVEANFYVSWMAIGFGEDMGKAEMYVAHLNGGTGSVNLTRRISTDWVKPKVAINQDFTLIESESGLQDEKLLVTFTRDFKSTFAEGVEIDFIPNVNNNLIWACGTKPFHKDINYHQKFGEIEGLNLFNVKLNYNQNNIKNNNSISKVDSIFNSWENDDSKNNVNRVVENINSTNLNNTGILESAGDEEEEDDDDDSETNINFTHGGIMIFSWGILFPIGVASTKFIQVFSKTTN